VLQVSVNRIHGRVPAISIVALYRVVGRLGLSLASVVRVSASCSVREEGVWGRGSREVRTPTRTSKFLFSRVASCASCCRLLV